MSKGYVKFFILQLLLRCICGILKDRVRILVTHQIKLLDKVDRIFAIQDGRIKHSGSLNQLIEEGVDFATLLHVNDKEIQPALKRTLYVSVLAIY